jgi:predicted HTH domain antitoxin
MQLTITIPDSLPDSLQATPGEFEREARMAMAVKLYERKRISSGVAARLVDMDRATFLLELHRYGAPMIDIDQDELLSDQLNA